MEPDIPVAIPVPFQADFSQANAYDFKEETCPPIRPSELDGDQLEFLSEEGFPKGLSSTLSEACSIFALRIWVVDNSGSMSNNDGKRLVHEEKYNSVMSIRCTRWSELQETVTYHAKLAAAMKAPTIFRLLNDPGYAAGPQMFSIAERGEGMIDHDLQIAVTTIDNARPTGATPLIKHINEIREQIEIMAPTLESQGRKVAIILATDGLPTNPIGMSPGNERENFTAAMKSLEGLPVWVVIRLCTDSEHIVNYYNDLDRQLELSIEVLDNYTDEALEMYRPNPWLNYTLQLHRMREMGLQKRFFDFLDERPLTLSELNEFCIMLFGEEKFAGVPSPEQNLKEFVKAIEILAKGEPNQWHPVKRTMKSLVSADKMKRMYGTGDGCCSIM